MNAYYLPARSRCHLILSSLARQGPILLYLFLLAAILLFIRQVGQWLFGHAEYHFYVLAFFFYLSFASLAPLYAYWAFRMGLKRITLKKLFSGHYDIILALAYGLFFVFVFLGSYHSGRYIILFKLLSDALSPQAASVNYFSTTYVSFFYSLFGLLGFPATPLTIEAVNRLSGALILLLVYLLAKKLLHSRLLGFASMVVFSSSFYVKWNIASIDYSAFSMLFVLLSYYFLIRYSESGSSLEFAISFAALLIASFVRIEMGIIAGIPFLMAYSAVRISGDGPCAAERAAALFGVLVLALISLPLFNYYFNLNDPNLVSPEHKSDAASFLKSRALVFYKNVFIDRDLLLASGRVSLFFYTALPAALVFLGISVFRIVSGSPFGASLAGLCLLSSFFLLYLFIQTFGDLSGLKDPWKSSFFIFHVCIILSFYSFKLAWDFFLARKPAIAHVSFLRPAYFAGISLAFILLSPRLGIGFDYDMDVDYIEYSYITGQMEPDRSCFILKQSLLQPNLDYFFGAQEQSVYLGTGEDYYRGLESLNKSGRCFYYHHGLTSQGLGLTKYDTAFMGHVNISRIDSAFSGCIASAEVEKVYSYRKGEDFIFLVKKYDCRNMQGQQG